MQLNKRDLEQILGLFPVSVIRENWDLKGNKEEICAKVSNSADRDEIIDFVSYYFDLCKQHVYLLDAGEQFSILEGALHPLRQTAVRSLYVARSSYEFVVAGQSQVQHENFVWPVRIDRYSKTIAVKFIVIEREIGTMSDANILMKKKAKDEAFFLRCLGDVTTTDIHKGIKSLWHDDMVDAVRIRYKKPGALMSQAMDEKRGLKATDPVAYEYIKKCPLFDSLFHIVGGIKTSIKQFSVNPSTGRLAFTSYSEGREDVGNVVGEILRRNG